MSKHNQQNKTEELRTDDMVQILKDQVARYSNKLEAVETKKKLWADSLYNVTIYLEDIELNGLKQQEPELQQQKEDLTNKLAEFEQQIEVFKAKLQQAEKLLKNYQN